MKLFVKAAACFAILLSALSYLRLDALVVFGANPTSSPVYVNGRIIAFRAYTIGENNYFKLRDIALVLSGTAKQFEVKYIAATHAIELYRNTAYTSVGGELASPNGGSVNAHQMASKVYLDGAPVALSAYTIGENNYFKLRDIAAAIDFGVIWDSASKTIRIDTSTGYEAERTRLESIVIDHSCLKLDQIPVQWVEKAKTDLHIAYGHTSHGSQLTTGMLELTQFKGSPFLYNGNLSAGSLDLRDNPFGDGLMDLGQPDYKTWAAATRSYLSIHSEINVVVWSWCGQLSWAEDRDINTYLSLMQELEAEFPSVTFVYMTGHLDGAGENGTLALNNKKIREYCIKNNKALYDFADIESYNPDGVYFGDKYADDACNYDSDGDRKPDKNWAIEWQNNHVAGVDWYMCQAAHSQPVNANMKAYAAWWLLARIAGWSGISDN